MFYYKFIICTDVSFNVLSFIDFGIHFQIYFINSSINLCPFCRTSFPIIGDFKFLEVAQI